MNKRPDINIGDVVFCGREFLVVVFMTARGFVLCPLIGISDLRHRADHDLSLVDLVSANLPSPYVRVRAIPCVRRASRLTWQGSLPRPCVDSIRRYLVRELQQSDRRTG